MELEQLKYPIGQFNCPEVITDDILHSWISEIQHFPEYVMAITNTLSKEKLQLRYRPYGWNIKQVVHHCADSHMNAFIRFKFALTEENPTIKPYPEDLWAELIDGNEDDVTYSLLILKGLHHKWHLLLLNMNEKDWEKTYYHPESKQSFSLKSVAGLYAWHCKHHLAHIKQALLHENKFE